MEIRERLSRAVGFQWDAGNVDKSSVKHQVTPRECEQVFFNRPLVAAEDHAHSHGEDRFFCLGQTDAARFLFIAFTMREDLIRVISARDMSRKEREAYTRHG
jgi:uncharacterized protein